MDADDPAATSSAPPTSGAAFFDAPDDLPTLPPPPPPRTPSSSTLRRRPRRAKILKQPDDPVSPSASASSTVTAADGPDKDKAKPDSDSSEATSAPRSPPPLEEEVDKKDAEPAAPEANVDEKDAEPADPEEEVDEKDAEPEAAAPDNRRTAAPPGILESLAVLVIKAVVFQVSALIACLAFPFRLLQWWYLLVTDPLGSAQRARDWALGVAGQATGAVNAWLGAAEGVGRVAGRLLWGSLWAMYVCVVLCALLAMAFMAGGLLVGKVVEEPVQVTENLNFDYTKPSPVAFVPVGRLVPPHQRMQLEVSLTLPESDYNRRLGVFQVIRLKMTGIKEAFEPITGVRILLEQRAEFAPGSGIPEIYAASLKLEAELPLLKRVLWHWRWTMFVWSSMGFFVFELLLAVVCCRPCIFPRSGHGAV